MKKFCLICLVLVGVLFFISCSNAVPTLKSCNDDFEILKMVESDNKSVAFLIRDCDDSFEKILFSSSRYSNLKNTQAYWAKTNNDFFVISHDVGVEPYIFNNNTWETGFVVEFAKSQQDEYTARLIKVPVVDNVEITTDYDINNIPDEVLDYFLIPRK